MSVRLSSSNTTRVMTLSLSARAGIPPRPPRATWTSVSRGSSVRIASVHPKLSAEAGLKVAWMVSTAPGASVSGRSGAVTLNGAVAPVSDETASGQVPTLRTPTATPSEAPTRTKPNSALVVMTATRCCTPRPASATVRTESSGSSVVTRRVSSRTPVLSGSKRIETCSVSPAARPSGSAGGLTSAMPAAPEASNRPLTASESVPQLAIATLRVMGAPTWTSPKSRVSLTQAAGASPVPRSPTGSCPLPGSSLPSHSVALSAPAACGRNSTSMRMESPAAIGTGSVGATTRQALSLDAAASSDSGAVPVFRTRRLHCRASPTPALPKSSVAAEAARCGSPPVPVRTTRNSGRSGSEVATRSVSRNESEATGMKRSRSATLSPGTSRRASCGPAITNTSVEVQACSTSSESLPRSYTVTVRSAIEPIGTKPKSSAESLTAATGARPRPERLTLTMAVSGSLVASASVPE